MNVLDYSTTNGWRNGHHRHAGPFHSIVLFFLFFFYSAAVHPGQCPVGKLSEGISGACVESCSNDNDCSAEEKCCSNGCGHTCMPAEVITRKAHVHRFKFITLKKKNLSPRWLVLPCEGIFCTNLEKSKMLEKKFLPQVVVHLVQKAGFVTQKSLFLFATG